MTFAPPHNQQRPWKPFVKVNVWSQRMSTHLGLEFQWFLDNTCDDMESIPAYDESGIVCARPWDLSGTAIDAYSEENTPDFVPVLLCHWPEIASILEPSQCGERPPSMHFIFGALQS